MAAATPTVLNPWRDRLLRGEICAVMACRYFISNEIAGMMRTAGLTGTFIDMEHAMLTIREVAQLVTACNYAGVSPIVRAPSSSHWHISRILDAGAAPVVVPHCESVEHARAIAKHAKYPPLGQRSSDGTSSLLGFQSIPTQLQNKLLNSDTMVIPMIETYSAIEAADEIFGTPGIDGVLIGSVDLCVDLEIPGQFDNPRYHDAVKKVIAAGVRARKPVGVGGIGGRDDLLEEFFASGASWAVTGADASILQAGMKSMAETFTAMSDRVQSSWRTEAKL